ncbi:Monoterpene epsilon-lactone hydrolase [uncultured Clostridium sp.]|uniref:Alpha/beta hydrolase n=1 Tax=Muricoprocola aceti TaxID=2981772 RepID=A0ABT2SND3_9FIRM|nr:alpha/beta hydrolase [Muricoprocola aceti]MCU6726027.1 alpha/beta hydrolase [Muricoprocola aceti]SCH74845.1 Monoterpene epsilon-lactone hydrolase [uncultured Clostridium sp.]
MSELSRKMQIEFLAGDNRRDEGLVTPEDVVRYDNLSYGPDPVYHVLDVYRPKKEDGYLPVIVNVHGGGWVYGTKETYQFYGMNLAQRGFAVVNFSYRLAPETKFPGPLEDMNQVIQWMYDHAEEYKLDMDHVFAVGDSAGCNILGMYCSICTDHEYAMEFPFVVPNVFRPKAIAMNCGAFRIFQPDGSVIWENDKILMQDYLPNGGDEKERSLINVVDHINPDFPPTFIMDAYGDFLLVEVPWLVEELVKKQVSYAVRIYGSKDQQLDHVFHVNIKHPVAKVCNDDECSFFKSYV